MNRRLQQFLSAENLTQAQFADAIGVARASISHILAGRNKPGFEFIERMAVAYPDISLDWLILGKGKMYKRGGNDIFAQLSPVQNATESAQEGFLEAKQEVEAEMADDSPDDMPENLFDEEETSPEEPEETIEVNEDKSVDKEKVISKVIIFYSDNTFTEIK